MAERMKLTVRGLMDSLTVSKETRLNLKVVEDDLVDLNLLKQILRAGAFELTFVSDQTVLPEAKGEEAPLADAASGIIYVWGEKAEQAAPKHGRGRPKKPAESEDRHIISVAQAIAAEAVNMPALPESYIWVTSQPYVTGGKRLFRQALHLAHLDTMAVVCETPAVDDDFRVSPHEIQDGALADGSYTFCSVCAEHWRRLAAVPTLPFQVQTEAATMGGER